jgi:hypothetical protein
MSLSKLGASCAPKLAVDHRGSPVLLSLLLSMAVPAP